MQNRIEPQQVRGLDIADVLADRWHLRHLPARLKGAALVKIAVKAGHLMKTGVTAPISLSASTTWRIRRARDA